MTDKWKEEPIKQRHNANARERDRTFSVNMAFNTLRTLIPTEPADRKLSKIETLRLASSYISHLDAVLIAGVIDQPCMKLDNNFRRPTNKPNNFYTRPQVCTFCLSSQKKYSLGVTSSILPDLNCQQYREEFALYKSNDDLSID